ncbi:hypothetical protein [Phaeobacter inhibens]|uniref:hypothetical protein n=1 Tax=Phaeobacter inhibens TaxID=221822 RepID=UPI000C9D15A2|nr:hypothetical protein [Phaeobacter inhibens]AUQ54502.1 hypothetical protein PhaeoP92_01825 [Phaeobacter inhibens]AUQ78518.1 hypothetical protein PhaeoP74_01826 [Phaeobacter inhibens]AUR15677.1 hypothetical protein PhaeoP70_01824 [Phaeobacter inhibens]
MSQYTLNGARPASLPQKLRLPNGRWRTAPYTEADLTAAGYAPAPAKPAYDPATERLDWQNGRWTVEPLPPRDPVYRPLTKLEAMTLFRHITGMDDAGELAMREDPAIKLLWMKWETDVPQSIRREHAVVGIFLDGLIAADYATAEHKAAMLAAWPQEG